MEYHTHTHVSSIFLNIATDGEKKGRRRKRNTASILSSERSSRSRFAVYRDTWPEAVSGKSKNRWKAMPWSPYPLGRNADVRRTWDGVWEWEWADPPSHSSGMEKVTGARDFLIPARAAPLLPLPDKAIYFPPVPFSNGIFTIIVRVEKIWILSKLF